MAMVAVSACSSQEAEDLNNNTADKATITAVIATTSRTYAEDGGSATWAKGDQFYALSTGHIYTNEDADNAASATFTSSSSDAETSQYAVYPYFSAAVPSLSGENLTVTLPTEYEYTVTDNTFNANTNSPMLGTLSGSTYTFQHLVGVLRLQYPSLPAGTKSVKFEANVRITGAYTTTVADHELKQDTETAGNAVTINLSEATTAAVENARFIIPLPTGSYAGFKVSAIDADGTVLSTYTTYKTYTLALGDIALYDLKTQGTNVKVFNYSAYIDTTTDDTNSNYKTWNFGDGWGIYNEKGKSIGQGQDKYCTKQHLKMARDQDFFITVPTGKQITKINFSASLNKDLSDATTLGYGYIYKLGDKTFETTDYKYLPRDLKTLCEHTFVPETGLTGNVLIRFSGDGEGYILMTVTYTDVAE
jgi:hypothetical protein